MSDESAPIWHDPIVSIRTGNALADAIYNMERASRDYSMPQTLSIGGHQVIPEAAVEAATRRLAEENGWEGPYPEGLARAALEAAAPYMLKSAYDLGFEHGSNQPANPYKPNP